MCDHPAPCGEVAGVLTEQDEFQYLESGAWESMYSNMGRASVVPGSGVSGGLDFARLALALMIILSPFWGPTLEECGKYF